MILLQSVLAVVLDDRGGTLCGTDNRRSLADALFRFLYQLKPCTQDQRRPLSLLVAI